MKINLENLITISNYAKLKSLSRQHVYRLIESNELTLVKIDGISFIFMDDKAKSFIKKRR